MRTTLTLDDDVAARLNAEVRRSGRSLKEVVNAHLRQSLLAKPPQAARRFRVRARPMDPIDGLAFDDVEGLLDQVDGPSRR